MAIMRWLSAVQQRLHRGAEARPDLLLGADLAFQHALQQVVRGLVLDFPDLQSLATPHLTLRRRRAPVGRGLR